MPNHITPLVYSSERRRGGSCSGALRSTSDHQREAAKAAGRGALTSYETTFALSTETRIVSWMRAALAQDQQIEGSPSQGSQHYMVSRSRWEAGTVWCRDGKQAPYGVETGGRGVARSAPDLLWRHCPPPVQGRRVIRPSRSSRRRRRRPGHQRQQGQGQRRMACDGRGWPGEGGGKARRSCGGDIVGVGVGVGVSQGSIAPLGWAGTTIEGGEERVSGEIEGKRTER